MKEQSSILKPNNKLVGVKPSKTEEPKLPRPTGWRLLVLPFKMKEKTKGGVILAEDTLERQQVASAKCNPPFDFSFILKGKTKIRQPVGFGIFASSFFSDFFTPTRSFFGINIDDCSFFISLLIFI